MPNRHHRPILKKCGVLGDAERGHTDGFRTRSPAGHPGPALETTRCVLTGCRARAQSSGIGRFYWSTFTARATTRAVVDSAMTDWNDIRALAHLLSGMVSVGENANTLVRLT